MGHLSALLALAAAAVGSAAGNCYGPGERNQGAEGFPGVEYKPCCDGQAAVEKAGDWGKFCPGDGGNSAEGGCYGPGERNQGADGFPGVEYKPCCDGQAAVEKAGDWGKFCPGGGGNSAEGGCYGSGERNQGAEGFPGVEYKPCCDGQAAVEKAGDWGKFCPGGGGNSAEGGCYGPGVRNQGAEGFPGVEYKPCCDGQAAVEKAGDWGKFCPGGGGGDGGGGVLKPGDRCRDTNSEDIPGTSCPEGTLCKSPLDSLFEGSVCLYTFDDPNGFGRVPIGARCVDVDGGPQTYDCAEPTTQFNDFSIRRRSKCENNVCVVGDKLPLGAACGADSGEAAYPCDDGLTCETFAEIERFPGGPMQGPSTLCTFFKRQVGESCRPYRYDSTRGYDGHSWGCADGLVCKGTDFRTGFTGGRCFRESTDGGECYTFTPAENKAIYDGADFVACQGQDELFNGGPFSCVNNVCVRN